jgi:hypothetical protein
MAARIVNNPTEDELLGPEWFDSPAKFPAKPKQPAAKKRRGRPPKKRLPAEE